jgi:hypothetical protein
VDLANQTAESAACAGERQEGAECVALETSSRPAVAAVTALPELTIGEAGERATVRREERIEHRQRLGTSVVKASGLPL